ncbi:hypothetical protein ACPA9J_35925 [Pseudomonas aeruginosa]
MLTSSKDAKRFTHLKVGQEVKLKLDPKGELQALQYKQSELETIGLDKDRQGLLLQTREGLDRPAYRLCPWPHHQLAVRCRS